MTCSAIESEEWGHRDGEPEGGDALHATPWCEGVRLYGCALLGFVYVVTAFSAIIPKSSKTTVAGSSVVRLYEYVYPVTQKMLHTSYRRLIHSVLYVAVVT